MPAILFELDPTSEDATNVPVVLTDATWRVMEMDASPPPIDPMYASSADTEGDPFVQGRHKNRTISLTLLAKTTTDQLTQTAVYGLMQKLDKMRREGGTLKWTTQAGTVVVVDVLFAQVKSEITPELYIVNKAMKLSVDFECKPYLRGATVQMADHAETTLPAAIGVDTAVGGDVPATVRILIDEDQAVNQWWVVWGTQSRYYDSATSAALFYEAEGRTLLGTSAIVTQTGASGGGTNNAIEATLDTEFLSVLSTQATAAGAHLSHVGNYRVFARVMTPTANTGAVSVALQWGEGDALNPTTNSMVVFPVDSWDNSFRLLDLGQVHLSKATAGTQRWEGRFIAKSTVAGDKIRIDHFFLVPVDEGSGEASATARTQIPAAFTGRDLFTGTTAGNALNARVATIGGTWATSGDATDFLFSDDTFADSPARSEPLKRTTAAAGTSGRFAILGTATPTAVQVSTAIRNSGLGALASGLQLDMGVLARWTDSSNYVRGVLTRYQDPSLGLVRRLTIDQVLAGVVTNLVTKTGILASGSTDIWFQLKLLVTAEGQATLTLLNDAGTSVLAATSGYSIALATGGTLASGKSGIQDFTNATASLVRYFDDFSVFGATATDAAIFASQSLELRSDRVVREDSGGTLWQRPSSYEGDYPTFPPAGKEARSVRTIVKACRNDPALGADSAIDDLSFRATVTPRYLQLPA